MCPGRGTYNRGELGYLNRTSASTGSDFLDTADAVRAGQGQPGVRELDGATSFSVTQHGRGDNAAALIFASSFTDFLTIDEQRVDVVAVTGNSMGWYTALACAGALDGIDGFELANAMGSRMHRDAPGGQIIHTLVDDDWVPLPGRAEELEAVVETIDGLYVSIRLGQRIVFAGTDQALSEFEVRARRGPGQFPQRLPGHSAFHTPLLKDLAEAARAAHGRLPLRQPRVPMIDGQGRIWRPHMTATDALLSYTLGAQITGTYDFTLAVIVALREFAPDMLVILGPGNTLGGAVIQSLLSIGWRGLNSKEDYAREATGFVVSMGNPAQRSLVAA